MHRLAQITRESSREIRFESAARLMRKHQTFRRSNTRYCQYKQLIALYFCHNAQYNCHLLELIRRSLKHPLLLVETAPFVITCPLSFHLPSSFCNFGELCADADEKLFFSVRYNPYHVLHQLLHSVKTTSYNLISRQHCVRNR